MSPKSVETGHNQSAMPSGTAAATATPHVASSLPQLPDKTPPHRIHDSSDSGNTTSLVQAAPSQVFGETQSSLQPPSALNLVEWHVLIWVRLYYTAFPVLHLISFSVVCFLSSSCLHSVTSPDVYRCAVQTRQQQTSPAREPAVARHPHKASKRSRYAGFSSPTAYSTESGSPSLELPAS